MLYTFQLGKLVACDQKTHILFILLWDSSCTILPLIANGLSDMVLDLIVWFKVRTKEDA